MDFHIVRKGDSLRDIAEKHYGDSRLWRELAKVNGIREPDRIAPGQEIRLPASLYAFGRSHYSAPSAAEITIDVRTARRICDCDRDPLTTNYPYDQETFDIIARLKDLVLKASADQGVPAVAVAGAIADEYNTRRGAKRALDWFQDDVWVRLYRNWKLEADHFLDLDNKILNGTKNDLGIGNIKLETAKDMYDTCKDTFSEKNWDYQDLVKYIKSDGGTVHIAALVIKRAQDLLCVDLADFPMCRNEAVLVTFYKQGEKKYVDEKWKPRKAREPGARIRPGEGCRVCQQRERILAALGQTSQSPKLEIVLHEPQLGTSLKVGVWSPIRVTVYNHHPVDHVWLDPQSQWYRDDPGQYLAEGIGGDARNTYRVDKKAVVLPRSSKTRDAQYFSGGVKVQEMPPGRVAKFYLKVPKPGLSWKGASPPDWIASRLFAFSVTE
jgi:LysM repeat protein